MAACDYDDEADLCAHFAESVPKTWTVYAETGGWDLLLVRNEDGFQIGVQAKMHFNPHVLSQALDDHRGMCETEGPDCRAVLVPAGRPQLHMGRLAAHCGVTVITCARKLDRHRWRREPFDPELPSGRSSWSEERDWHEFGPATRIKLPEYVPDVAAGASAPLQLTEWKIKALKIAATLELRGFVTRQDFSKLHLDHRRWMVPGFQWLVLEGGVYKKGPNMPNFAAQHPKVYAEIKADATRWMAPSSELAQTGLPL